MDNGIFFFLNVKNNEHNCFSLSGTTSYRKTRQSREIGRYDVNIALTFGAAGTPA